MKNSNISQSVRPSYPTLNVTYRPIGSVKSTNRNARKHSTKQIRQIAESIKNFGFVNPVHGELLIRHAQVHTSHIRHVTNV